MGWFRKNVKKFASDGSKVGKFKFRLTHRIYETLFGIFGIIILRLLACIERFEYGMCRI
jgi:hypothetical protein